MTPKYSPILLWPPQKIHKIFIPQKIFIFLKTEKIIEIQIFELKKWPDPTFVWKYQSTHPWIDSRLGRIYKVTYDLVAIPASDYHVRNHRASQHIVIGIQTDPDSQRLLQVHVFPQNYYPLERTPCQHTDPFHPGTV